MARTYRRNTPRSQYKTLRYEKNLCVAKKRCEREGYWWYGYVNFKDDKRFYTDNQKTPNWKFEENLMSRRIRAEARRKLKKVRSFSDAEEVVLNLRERQEMPWAVTAYWD
mgnify:CR=1 FL=1